MTSGEGGYGFDKFYGIYNVLHTYIVYGRVLNLRGVTKIREKRKHFFEK